MLRKYMNYTDHGKKVMNYICQMILDIQKLKEKVLLFIN